MNSPAEIRPVRILFLMHQGPLVKALQHVLGTLSEETTQCEAEGADDADLIIFDDVRKVEDTYRPDKRYGYLETQRRELKLPSNVTRINIAEGVIGMMKLIADVRTSMPVEVPRPRQPVARAEVPKLPDARKVLVVDDTQAHLDSACELLGNHHLTICRGYESAMTMLGTSVFEIVLTDLHMPMSSRTMGDKFCLGELVPYGILIALEAARRGASHVAIVTDINHHNDPISAAFDYFSRFDLSVEKATVVMRHARFTAGGGKNWEFHLNELLQPK